MKLSRELLYSFLDKAFDLGNRGSYEMKDQAIEEIIEIKKENPLEVISLDDIIGLEDMSKLFHPLFGLGTVYSKSRYVEFEGFRMELQQEGWPWIYSSKVII